MAGWRGGREQRRRSSLLPPTINHLRYHDHVPAIYVAASISGGLIVFSLFLLLPAVRVRVRRLRERLRSTAAACLPALPAFLPSLSLGFIAAAALARSESVAENQRPGSMRPPQLQVLSSDTAVGTATTSGGALA